MVTTIQISERFKKELDSIKTKGETYEQILARIMKKANTNMLLMEYYAKYGKEIKAQTQEWDSTLHDGLKHHEN